MPRLLGCLGAHQSADRQQVVQRGQIAARTDPLGSDWSSGLKNALLTSEPKPTESYCDIVFLESGSSEGIRAVLLSLGVVPLSLFAVPMKPSLCTFPASS